MKTSQPSCRRCAAGVVFLSAVAALAIAGHGDQRNLIPDVRFSQDAINAGEVPFETLFFAGKHIMSNRFTPEDHFGEAPDGPRRGRQSIESRPALPFLRFNGLDAQSCQECHFFAGMGAAPLAQPYMIFPRESGSFPGGAGFAANVFIFDDFPASSLGVVRNPPHTFGLGYVQRLAEEMTADLLALRDEAAAVAALEMHAVDIELRSKDVHFGTLRVMPDGSIDLPESDLRGVSEDLVVRPFQFKGIAGTLRSFIAGAMNFHFSVQPKESLDRGVIANDNPNGTLPDDPRDEILEGDISAVAIFLGFMRPPMEDATGLDAEAVARGRQLFNATQCAACHVPSLRIDNPGLTIMDPRPLISTARARAARGLVHRPPATIQIVPPEASSADLQSVLLYERSLLPAPLPGFTRNLNLDGPPDSMPRLPFDSGTDSIDVPLFSDLKRHKMGDGLAEPFTQPTDVAGIDVPGDEFLTRPLWGVADTGPWLHDGRALALKDAILFHEGEGSEANDSIAAFKALDEGQREDLHQFLLSLRLRPLDPSTFNNSVSTWNGY
jgi:mono/diheme cytochrome c family protein